MEAVVREGRSEMVPAFTWPDRLRARPEEPNRRKENLKRRKALARSPDTGPTHRNPPHYRPLRARSIRIRRVKPANARSVSRPHQNQDQDFGSVEDPVRRMKRGAADREDTSEHTRHKGCDLECRRRSDGTPQN